jgi:hypothetical protein
MYGIVNKAIQELVIENFGKEKWEIIKEKSNINVDIFISSEPYDDDITYKLAFAISEEMKIPLSTVLETFGEWWVLRTAKEKYGGLMEAGGNGLKEFLLNLPAFHNRVILIYPKLTPPEFRVSNEEENSLHIHYISKRVGLQDFVKGLLIGLGKMYNTPANVELIQEKNENNDHEVFKVSW